MKTKRFGWVLASIPPLLLAACSDDAANERAPIIEGSPEALAIEAVRQCGRDAAGQRACLAAAFETSACDDAEVLSTMLLENAEHARLHHTTILWAGPDCHAALRESARERGFEGGNWQTFAPFGKDGYRETLDFTATEDWDGTESGQAGITWVRIKE